MALFFGYPIVKNVTMSFQEYTTSTFYTGQAPWVGLSNYVSVLTSSVFSTAMLNTFLFTVGSIAGQFTIGLALAVFFKRRFPLNGVMRSLILLPWLLPMIVSSAIWKWMLDKDSGVVNQLLQAVSLPAVPWLTSTSVALIAVIIVNIWLGIPFNMTILYSGLQDIPDELYEAASLDGAVGWKAFRYVTWPLLKPVVSVVLVLGVVYTLKVLDIHSGAHRRWAVERHSDPGDPVLQAVLRQLRVRTGGGARERPGAGLRRLRARLPQAQSIRGGIMSGVSVRAVPAALL